MQRMAEQGRDPDGPARFGEPGVLVLALSGGPKHGHAITTDAAERTGIQLGPGTLYESLAELEEEPTGTWT